MRLALRIFSATAAAVLWLDAAAIAQDNNPLASIRPGSLVPGRPPAAAPGRPNAPAAAGADKRSDAAQLEAGVPSLDDLTATRERPLFSSTRRPPEIEPAVQAASPIIDAASMPFELVGIVAGSDVNAAIFRDTDTKEESRVAKGDKIGNWSVEEITGRAVILRGADKRVRMRLFDESTAPGIKVGKASGEDEPATAPAADEDQEPVDEDIAPATSPQAKPATAQPKPPPSLAQGRNQGNPRRPKRPPRGVQRNQEP
jgi:general secretion pathway protein N